MFPTFLDGPAVLFACRQHDGFVLARSFQNPVLPGLVIPFQLRNSQGIIGSDVDRVVQRGAIRPQVAGSRTKQVAPGVPAVFIGVWIALFLPFHLD